MLGAGLALVLGHEARAQALDLGGTPGAAPVPIQITASQGIEWKQAEPGSDRHRQCQGGARRGDRDGRPADRALPQESRRATPAATANGRTRR
jgi:hypothetical protein